MKKRTHLSPSPGWLKQARGLRGWTQAEAAVRLGVSPGHLSRLERGSQPASPALLRKLQRVYEVPSTELPLIELSTLPPARLAAALAQLGYPPLAHLRGRTRLNPASLLLGALRRRDLEARLTEALPWVALRYVDLNWSWLLERAKMHEVQNRLGYVVALAGEVARRSERLDLSRELRGLARALEGARLDQESTLCRETMTAAERKWVRARRSRLARHWNLLTDLRSDDLPYVA